MASGSVGQFPSKLGVNHEKPRRWYAVPMARTCSSGYDKTIQLSISFPIYNVKHLEGSRALLGVKGVVEDPRGQIPTVALNSFVGLCATNRIGPSSAGTHAAAPRSKVTAVVLACTTVEPSVQSRICGPSWRVGASIS